MLTELRLHVGATEVGVLDDWAYVGNARSVAQRAVPCMGIPCPAVLCPVRPGVLYTCTCIIYTDVHIFRFIQTYIYIYIYMYVCIYMYRERERVRERVRETSSREDARLPSRRPLCGGSKHNSYSTYVYA